MTAARRPGIALLACLVAAAGCGGGKGGESTGGHAGTLGLGGSPGTGGAAGAGGSGGGGGIAGASGTPGTGGITGGGGSIGTGGLAGAGGSPGLAGAGGVKGAAGMGGGGGTSPGTPDVCTFTIQDVLSTAIPTVGIVTWSTDLAGLGGATIEFTLDDPAPGEINTGSGGPIDITGTPHRALMLGLKAQRTYTYRIVATAGATVCTSPDRKLTTGAATAAPTVTRTAGNPAAQDRGFIIAAPGVSEYGNVSPDIVYIIDADGDVVWWAASPKESCRALMDWQGANMWMMACNQTLTQGELRQVSMDGTDVASDPAFALGHHDFTVVPGGGLAVLVGITTGTQASYLVERLPDGTAKTVVLLDSTIYQTSTAGAERHVNALRYHPADDSYTVGDRDSALLIKLTRQGQPLWQFGGTCTGAVAPKCVSVPWPSWVHGHHLLANGNLLLFFNGDGLKMSPVYEYSLTGGATSLAATQVWSYVGNNLGSLVLGDVQGLPNGNTLITYSNEGIMLEVSPAGAVVQTIAAPTTVTSLNTTVGGTFGYSSFRETLYGPPLP